MPEPKCFISYSWDSDNHKKWVRNLATHLSENGVLVYLDQWDVRPGLDLPQYMETAVRNSDHVLLICTPAFGAKANTGKGGVGYEKSVVTGEIFTQTAHSTKFVPVLRAGQQNESLPSYLKSKVFVDFRSNERAGDSLEELLRHIYKEPIFKRPSLGKRPEFSIYGEDTKPTNDNESTNIEDIFSLKKYKKFFEFANAYDQMGLSKSEAIAWADKWVEGMTEDKFNLFKNIFKFASGYDKLSLSKDSAIRWTENIVQKLTEVKILEIIEGFGFASDYQGLGLDKREAYNWAFSKLGFTPEAFPVDF